MSNKPVTSVHKLKTKPFFISSFLHMGTQELLWIIANNQDECTVNHEALNSVIDSLVELIFRKEDIFKAKDVATQKAHSLLHIYQSGFPEWQDAPESLIEFLYISCGVLIHAETAPVFRENRITSDFSLGIKSKEWLIKYLLSKGAYLSDAEVCAQYFLSAADATTEESVFEAVEKVFDTIADECNIGVARAEDLESILITLQQLLTEGTERLSYQRI